MTAERFAGLDVDFKDMLKHFKQTPNCVESCAKPGFLKGLEAVADRAGVKASELVDGTQAEVDARRLEVRTQVMEGDKQLLETLCQRGALRPAEMKHSIDASITGVDDEASWLLQPSGGVPK